MVGRIAAVTVVLIASPAFAQTRQAVLDTTAGTIVMDLLADKAPNHVAHFIKTAESGGYDATTFFRMIKYGIVQGGDPVTKDPNARARYGTGGLNLLKPEITDEKQTRGAVSATLIPGKADSAGSQFFIAVTDQPGIDGKYTIFARVVEGMRAVEKISETAVDGQGWVYVTDAEANRIQIFAPDGTVLGGWGTRGEEAGQFQEPRGIALDGQGAVYVTDFFGERVQKFRLLPPLAP